MEKSCVDFEDILERLFAMAWNGDGSLCEIGEEIVAWKIDIFILILTFMFTFPTSTLRLPLHCECPQVTLRQKLKIYDENHNHSTDIHFLRNYFWRFEVLNFWTLRMAILTLMPPKACPKEQ